ncbi:MAG: glycogen synthase GlgA [Gammaproteobacteria bacterium]
MRKILFACSELHPLIKTGGLGDVAGYLPVALKELRQDIRVVMPAYRAALACAGEFKPAARLNIIGSAAPVTILEGRVPGTQIKLYLIDAPHYFDRPGGPYADIHGHNWPDNAARFALFARAVVSLALDQAGLGWRPDLVHCNDWQTGLVPALLTRETKRPATLFTIHNLAYQGVFSREIFDSLSLPPELWSLHALEFHGQLSFIKGGLVYADWLSTVSPTYAREIRTAEFGCGLEGLLDHRATRLTGILNGVDYNLWDPRHDPFIAKNYNSRTLQLKTDNKADVQRRFHLPEVKNLPLIGFVGRLVEQKGIDLLLRIMPELMRLPLQIVIVGSGERDLEQALLQCAATYPERVGVTIGYDEELAHCIEAGVDIFLMPSRFEPCGLNQIYSLRYGTVPVVRRTGGLADTIVDTTPQTSKNGTANGFVFDAATPAALLSALLRAIHHYSDTRKWRALARRGMAQDFSWEQSARRYLDIYQKALEARRLTGGAGHESPPPENRRYPPE